MADYPLVTRHTMVCTACHRGWDGAPGDRCSNCKDVAEVRGVILVAQLPQS